MRFLHKPLMAVGLIAVIGATVVFWTPLSSYVRTAGRTVGDAARGAVPTAFEIERIDTLIHDLDRVVVEQQTRLIAQRLDLEYLEAEVDRTQTGVEHLTAEVREAQRLLNQRQASYRIGERDYDAATVERDARSKAERLLRAREINAAKTQTVATLRAALANAEAQLDTARQQREAYAMRLSELEAKAQNVAIRRELAVTVAQLPGTIKAGAFQEVETAFARIEKDLAVQDRLLAEQANRLPAGEVITFTRPAGEDVLVVLDRALGTTDRAIAEAPTAPALTPLAWIEASP